MRYQVIEQLQQFKTDLLDAVELSSGMQLAMWQNNQDQVHVCSNHHTLSLYIEGGYQSFHKTQHGWHNGGGPDHFCLLPKQSESCWELRDPLRFVHLYYTDQHLHDVAVQVWDKEPHQITLNEQVYAYDPHISLLYHHFLLAGTWQHTENHLQISSASTLLLNHLLKNYSSVQWQLPRVKGGLAPYQLKQILAWIDAHLDQALTISDLASQCQLSDYHFAHMFKHSMQMPPHQYVMQRRLQLAYQALKANLVNQDLGNQANLTQIAARYGFSSSSHFSTRFKKHFGFLPSQFKSK